MNKFLILRLLCLVWVVSSCVVTRPPLPQLNKIQKIPCAPATCEVLNESQLNRKHQEGFVKGERYGFLEGYRLGHKAGRTKGFVEGMDKGQLDGQIMAYDYVNKLFNPPFLRGSPEHLQFAQMMEKTIHAQVRVQGRRDAFNSQRFKDKLRDKYLEGQNDCFQQTYRANLRLGQQINLKQDPTDLPLIDYEYVVNELKGVRGNYGYAAPATFNKVLYHLHKEILGYIARMLEENEDLIDDKIGNKLNRKEVFQEYDRLHNALATQYYRQYLRSCQRLNLHYKKSFYNHALYFSADILIGIVNAGLCALVDTILTYVKSNTQYAAIAGFETLGNACELISAKVRVDIGDKLKKRALILDFNENRYYMEQALAQSLKNIIVTHRVCQKELAPETIYSHHKQEFNYSLELKTTLGIRAVASVGVEVGKMSLVVDEKTQSITVFIPDTPKVLEIVNQSYWVKEQQINNAYEHRTITYMLPNKNSSLPSPRVDSRQHKAQIAQKTLETIFQDNKFKLSEVQAQQLPLDYAGIDKIKQIVKKVIEPILVLPSSCFRVYMVFKGQVSKVHEVSCDGG